MNGIYYNTLRQFAVINLFFISLNNQIYVISIIQNIYSYCILFNSRNIFCKTYKTTSFYKNLKFKMKVIVNSLYKFLYYDTYFEIMWKPFFISCQMVEPPVAQVVVP